jgi:hypothetical protein
MYCCGWREISALRVYRGDFDAALRGLFDKGVFTRDRVGCGSLLFNGTSGDNYNGLYASKFARDIRKRKLGKVVKLPSFRNPNTGRIIYPYMWMVDTAALLAYCQKNNIFPPIV